MALLQVLSESIKLLRKEPKNFIPRFMTTFLFSIIALYIASILTDFMKAYAEFQDYGIPFTVEDLSPLSSATTPLLFLIPLMILVDLLSYGMYPALIKDYVGGRKVSIMNSIREALYSWKVLLFFMFFVLAYTMVFSFIAVVLVALFYVTNSILILVFSLLLMAASLFLLVVLLFFMIPVGVIEKRGAIDSFTQGISIGLKHKWDVIKINLLFTVLITSTLLLLSLLDYFSFPEELIFLAGAIFVIGRVIEAIVYTYISVVNPYFYMKVR